MITNRTEQDVARWKELHDKGWVAMSAAERTEWQGEMKGRYSYTDMNRVEDAVAELSDLFVFSGWLSEPLETMGWSHLAIPAKEDMERYLGNIRALRNAAPVVYHETPHVPSISQPFDYQKANDLEQILIDLKQIYHEQTTGGGYHAGEIYSGEV